jgi:3-oxoacyl-[acyl-carrier protein] reductase
MSDASSPAPTAPGPGAGRDLAGRVALVTGSTAGIGFRIVEALALRGARVAMNGRNPATGEAALQRLGESAKDVVFVEGDVTRYDQAQRVIGETGERLGPLDILVCSGGTDTPGPTPFHEMQPELFMQAFEARYLARVFPIHAAIAGMRERRRGAILLVTTDGGRQVTPGHTINGSIGAATILTTKALALESAKFGIRVNCLALTLTSDTPRYDEIVAGTGYESRVFGAALAKFPFGAAPTASEVARVAAFLVSEDACQITGQTVSVNGGLSYGGW